MNRLIPNFFQNKKWSTSSVLQETVSDANSLNLSLEFLPTLSDIDELDDLIQSSLLEDYPELITFI
jgi:glycosyltransferase A (GT-A) superfamily protein (DUF2064 family)